MTKKDFELFAHKINKLTVTNKTKEIIVNLTCEVFTQSNPLFQEDKYRRACYEGKHIRTSIKNT